MHAPLCSVLCCCLVVAAPHAICSIQRAHAALPITQTKTKTTDATDRDHNHNHRDHQPPQGSVFSSLRLPFILLSLFLLKSPKKAKVKVGVKKQTAPAPVPDTTVHECSDSCITSPSGYITDALLAHLGPSSLSTNVSEHILPL